MPPGYPARCWTIRRDWNARLWSERAGMLARGVWCVVCGVWCVSSGRSAGVHGGRRLHHPAHPPAGFEGGPRPSHPSPLPIQPIPSLRPDAGADQMLFGVIPLAQPDSLVIHMLEMMPYGWIPANSFIAQSMFHQILLATGALREGVEQVR
eukprot:5809787-Pyramimonas_sp.AAC.1